MYYIYIYINVYTYFRGAGSDAGDARRGARAAAAGRPRAAANEST